VAENTPFVSVIMPIRNEGDFISRSLGAVLEQDYPHMCMEVLIADGMSSDDTRDFIAQTAAEHPDITVKILDNPGKIVPTGFNIALAKAAGDIIVRVDGHTIIDPDYVSHCVRLLQTTGAENVGGRMTAIGRGDFGEAVALATSSPFGVGGARFHYSDQEEWVDTVYMGAWPKAVFERNGGFDEELVRNQDDEFNYRLRANGGKILLSPKINSRYYNRSTLRSLWRQYYQYGFWKVRVLQKHPLQMSPRQFVPPAFAATILGGAVLAPFSRIIRVLWVLALALYIAGNLAASLQIARKTDEKHIKLLPGVFAILHFAYGLGFLNGLLKQGRDLLLPPTNTES
jgi:succinoglycan biosynthesis protein ExoA